MKCEVTVNDFVVSVPATSSSEGTTPTSKEEVESSPTANEKSDESISGSIKNEIGIGKDGMHQEQSTSQLSQQ